MGYMKQADIDKPAEEFISGCAFCDTDDLTSCDKRDWSQMCDECSMHYEYLLGEDVYYNHEY